MQPKIVNIGKEVETIFNTRPAMTLKDLGKALNMAPSNIRKQIFAKTALSTDTLTKLCEVLEYDFFSLFTCGSIHNTTNTSDNHIEIKDIGKSLSGDNNIEISIPLPNEAKNALSGEEQDVKTLQETIRWMTLMLSQYEKELTSLRKDKEWMRQLLEKELK